MPLYNPTSAGTVADGSITSAKILDGTIATADIASGAITAALISAAAGGDLSGTLPSPTVAKVNGVALTGTPSTGYVPTATGAAAATWQAPNPSFTITTGNYMPTATQNTGTGTPTLSQLRAYPIIVWKTQTFDRIGIEVTTFTASAVVRLGIYNDNGAGMPGTLVLDAGTVDAGASNSLKTITISQSLPPGVYWLAAVSQTAAPAVRILNGGGPYRHVLTSSDPTNYSFSIAEAATVSSITGALPTPFGATGTAGAGNAPYVVLRSA